MRRYSSAHTEEHESHLEAFLDVLLCGLGAALALMIVYSVLPKGGLGAVRAAVNQDANPTTRARPKGATSDGPTLLVLHLSIANMIDTVPADTTPANAPLTLPPSVPITINGHTIFIPRSFYENLLREGRIAPSKTVPASTVNTLARTPSLLVTTADGTPLRDSFESANNDALSALRTQNPGRDMSVREFLFRLSPFDDDIIVWAPTSSLLGREVDVATRMFVNGSVSDWDMKVAVSKENNIERSNVSSDAKQLPLMTWTRKKEGYIPFLMLSPLGQVTLLIQAEGHAPYTPILF